MPRANRVAAYAAAFATAVRNGLAYPGELAVGCVFMVVIFFIFANLWPAAYAGREQVEGLTLAQLLIYLVATETLVMTPRVWHVIQAEIRSGDVAIHWARPIDYGLWHLAGFLGEAVVRAPLTFAVGAAIVWLRTGELALSPAALVALPGFALALVLTFAVELVVGLSAFWTEDAAGWSLLVAMSRLLAGGVLMPLEMLPGWLAEALRWLPFPAMIYGPARLLADPDPAAAAALLATQAAWLAVLGGIARLMLAAAQRRVFVHGG